MRQNRLNPTAASGAILRQEATLFLFRGPAAITVALVLLTVAYAGWSGDRWRDARIAGIEGFVAAQTAAALSWRAELVHAEQAPDQASPYAANPMNISFPAVMPPGSLGDFAVGHTDLHPFSSEISPWNNPSNLFGKYQFENPEMLAAGSFDVALVAVVLMPLMMIAVSFDLLSRERARGTLALTLCAPVSLVRILWTRLLFRNGLLWLVAIAAMSALVFINDDGGDRYARFAWWQTAVLAYWGFWLCLIAFLVARFRHATQSAAVLAGVWFVLVFAMPGLVSAVAEAIYPTPSRLALLSEVRDVEAQTSRDLAGLTDRFLTDHPELTVGDEGVPSFYRAAFLANDAARQVTAPLVDGFDEARRGRARALGLAQYLSPAIVAQRLLHLLADADLERQYRFQQQSRQALFELANAVGPAIVSRNRITTAEFDNLRAFTFVDRTLAEVRGEFPLPLAFLFAAGLLFAVAASRRLKDEESWT